MEIRPASEAEAPLLSSIALRAKAHWNYPSEALERWRSELTVSPKDVRAKPTFVAVVDAEIAGFCSLRPAPSSWELDHLWVLPGFMHRGIGRALLSHALDVAASSGATEITIDADPNAEAFYLKCGAIRQGVVAAPIPGQPERVRPQLAFHGRAI
jgi:ribosomal protein S18 acetylase RimI-like enzyme